MTKKIRVTSRNKWIICHEWSSISGNNHLHRTKKQICRFEEKKLFGKKGTKHQAVPLKHKTCSTFLRTSYVLLALSFCQRSLNESYHHQNDFRGAPARRCHIPNRFGYSQTAEGVVAVCCNERLHESRATDQT